ncbi:MAG: hypothetical protein ACE5HI_11285, partial [bacterium]
TAALKLVETIFNQGYDLGEFLNSLTEHFRNILVVKATNQIDLLEGLESYGPKYQETAQSFTQIDILRLIKLSSETSYQIKRSSNPKMILEMLLVKMVKMEKSVELNQLLTYINKLNNPPVSNSGGSAKSSEKLRLSEMNADLPASKDSDKVVKDKNANEYGSQTVKGDEELICGEEAEIATLGQIKDKWSEIIDEVRNKKIHLGSFLNEGYPTNMHDGILEISFGNENGFHINSINQNKQLIQNVIFNQTGIRLKIQCKKNDSAEFKEIILNHKPEIDSQKQADDDNSLQIPIVKKVIELFDGEIVR